jgi:methionyl-tRNA formyltransferase
MNERAGAALRVVFLGSGAFAIPSFEALVGAGHDVAALVTQPDKEKGRGRALSPPPLKPVADRLGIPVLQPRRVRLPEAQGALRELKPDVQVVVAYGQILPRSVIDIAPLGTVNVHASLLPRYRGAAPIQWAIVNGDKETGVTTMLIDEGLDTGPTLLDESTPIGAEETAADLEPRLARMGAQVLLRTLDGLVSGELVPVPQDGSRAVHAPIIKKEDGRVDWSLPARAIADRARGFFPWPGVWTMHEGRLLKLIRVRAEDTGAGGSPGEVVSVDAEGVKVAAGAGSVLRLLVVQPESRAAMDARAWAGGYRVQPGTALGA